MIFNVKKKPQDEKMNVITKVVMEEVNVDDEHKDAIEVIVKFWKNLMHEFDLYKSDIL